MEVIGITEDKGEGERVGGEKSERGGGGESGGWRRKRS